MSRIGPLANATRIRQKRYFKAQLWSMVAIPVCWYLEWTNHMALFAAFVCAFFVTEVVLAVAQVRVALKAGAQAAGHLGLDPKQTRNWIPLRHRPEDFDRWLAAKGQPGWPKRPRP